MKHAVFKIVKASKTYILLRDVGDHAHCLTITNDAEYVVEQLCSRLRKRRLFYYDSDGDLTELVVKDGEFAHFRVLTCLPPLVKAVVEG